MRTTTGEIPLRQLSEALQAVVEQHPEEHAQERFYLCSRELADKLEPRWMGISGSEHAQSSLRYLQWIRDPAPALRQRSKGPHELVAISGEEAEERWPMLVLAKQLEALEVSALGVERATWSEVVWGAAMISISRDASISSATEESIPHSELNLLNMARWRSRWAMHVPSIPTRKGWISANAWEAAKEDMLRGPISMMVLAEMLGTEATCSRHDTISWLQGTCPASGEGSGWASFIERAKLAPQEIDPWHWKPFMSNPTGTGRTQSSSPAQGGEVLPGLNAALQQSVLQSTSGLLEWKTLVPIAGEEPAENKLALAWAAFPELGEGTVVVALSEDLGPMTVAMISTSG